MSKETGILIKEARTAAGLSQKKLAEKVEGLSVSALGKAERGEKELTPQQLEAIAEVLGVAPESLRELTDEEILGLFKAADPATKKAAIGLLKGEKPQGGDMMSMFASMMGGGAGAEGAAGGENPMAGMMSMFSGMMGGGAGAEGAAGGEGGENPMAGMMSMFSGMMGGGAGAEGAEGAAGGENPMAGMMSMFGGMMGGAAGNQENAEGAPAEEKKNEEE